MTTWEIILGVADIITALMAIVGVIIATKLSRDAIEVASEGEGRYAREFVFAQVEASFQAALDLETSTISLERTLRAYAALPTDMRGSATDAAAAHAALPEVIASGNAFLARMKVLAHIRPEIEETSNSSVEAMLLGKALVQSAATFHKLTTGGRGEMLASFNPDNSGLMRLREKMAVPESDPEDAFDADRWAKATIAYLKIRVIERGEQPEVQDFLEQVLDEFSAEHLIGRDINERPTTPEQITRFFMQQLAPQFIDVFTRMIAEIQPLIAAGDAMQVSNEGARS